MTVQTFFRPPRYDQLKGSVYTRSDDCGPSAVKVLIRRWSLGSQDLTIYAIRKAAGKPRGQFDVYDVAEALRYFGVTVAGTYTRHDNFEWPALSAWLKAGNIAILLGDYDEIPNWLSGDPNFNGNHFTFANERLAAQTGPLVYDSLADGRRAGIPKAPLVWPDYITSRYLHGLSDKLDYDVTVVLVRRRTVKRKLDNVPVYPTPDDTGTPVNWHTGPLEYGALVRGGMLNDPPDPRWYRVWWPYTAAVKFVSAAHVTVAS